ncbi:MAG: hypothetical protein J6328_04325 [Bacilli bacterium]|nr:hypothetical protein [Bacilli bacterium]
MSDKKQMSEEKKIKMIFSGEYLLFALVFLILGILILTRVWVLNGDLRIVFVFVSMAGSIWIWTDFFWTLSSKKRRKDNPLLDKSLPLPAATVIFASDIVSLLFGLEATRDVHQYSVGGIFAYLGLIFLFLGLYHYKHPHPLILKEIEELKKEVAKEKETIIDTPLDEGETEAE